MKLRQKLAVVLAASMVATAVPVVTLADTSNSSHCDVYVRDGVTVGYSETNREDALKDTTTYTEFTINSNAYGSYAKRNIPNLELYPKDNYTNTKETFYVTLTDGEFNFAAYQVAAQNLADAGKTYFGGSTTGAGLQELGQKTNDYYIKDDVVYKADGTALSGKKAEDTIKYEQVLTYKNEKDDGTLTYTLLGDKEMKVEVTGNWYTSNKNTAATSLYVPLFLKAKSTQVKIKVDGSDSFISTSEFTLGSKDADGKELAVTADDAAKGISVDGGEISKLILTEQVLDAIKNSENGELKLKLPSSSGLEFKLGATATGKRAFASDKHKDVELPTTFGEKNRRNTETDRQVLVIKLPKDWAEDANKDTQSRGVIELTGIKVQPVDDKAKVGDLSLTVSAVDDDDFINESKVTVGKVCEYGATLTCDKPATIKAGRSAIVNDYTVEVKLEENTDDSITNGRDIKFSLDNGYIISAADVLNYAKKETSYFSSKTSTTTTKSDTDKLLDAIADLRSELNTKKTVEALDNPASSSAYKTAALTAVRNLVDNEDIKFEEDGKALQTAGGAKAIKNVEINADGQVIGFTVDGDVLDGDSHKNLSKDDSLNKDEKDLIKITKLPVATPLQATGEVKLKVSGRAFAELGEEKAITCKIADIVSPIKVDLTAAELKVGLQEQQAGELTITETDKDMFQKGTLVVDADPDASNGISFQTKPEVTATGVTLGDVSLSANKRFLYIDIKETSTEAAKISVKNMKFTTDRTVPEGTFPVRFYGDALTDEDIKTYDGKVSDKYIVDNFIKITTPNTEDIKNGALKAVTSKFTLGSTKYSVDGVEQEMDAAAYENSGRIMVPLRYVAYAFGLEESNVLFGNGTATIVAGEKILQFKINSNVMTVNGSPITMDTKAEAKSGRIFVPMSYIAAGLGVKSDWDNSTKTATFSNTDKKVDLTEKKASTESTVAPATTTDDKKAEETKADDKKAEETKTAETKTETKTDAAK